MLVRMDLVSALQLALSTNPDQRNAGEDRLHQFQYAQGHLVELLQVIVTQHFEPSVRQVASIRFRNLIARAWSRDDPPEDDKTMVRDNILEAIVHAPSLIRVQLGECMKTIIHVDYPERWHGLLSGIDANLKAQDQQRAYGALFALQILTRRYQFEVGEERFPVHHVIDTTFPILLEIFQYLLALPNPSIEIADLIKLICKIFWFSIGQPYKQWSPYMEIPQMLQDPAWMACFHNLLERPVPPEGQPADLEHRKSWGWWKVKKWTLHIVNWLYLSCGDPKPENKEFASMFAEQFAGRFWDSSISLLGVVQQGGYLPDRVVFWALHYLNTSIFRSETYERLTQLDVVVFDIIFPFMCFNDIDEQLWGEDPHEYVRKGYHIFYDSRSPRTQAINFISALVRKRGKEFLQKYLHFIVEIFRRYDEAPLNQKRYRQKDGALFAVGVLNDQLMRFYRSELEQMLVQHVLPEFSSPIGHLRAKAAWVAGQYADFSFTEETEERIFRTALRSIIAALEDPELPVRIASVVALRRFDGAGKYLDEIGPISPQLYHGEVEDVLWQNFRIPIHPKIDIPA